MGREKPNMSVARIVRYGSTKIGACERHDERKNTDYGNVNVDPKRIPMNVHFKDPGGESYMDSLRRLEKEGIVSTRGLRMDAQLFDELTLDVNTYYFEEHGGYEYAVRFYEEAFHFAEKVYGADNIISAVMHADEINKAATAELGHPVYHYHLHVVALPVVDKEVRWTKRCKDPALVGMVKEVIHQISHSKKWEFTEPMLDEDGNPVLRKNGKPKFIPSYSLLQDDFYQHMTEHGFADFQRGDRGSTSVHLDSLQYQIQQDEKRLAEIEAKVKAEQIRYEAAHEVSQTFNEIEGMGKKTITGKVQVGKEDYETLTSLAKEGITSRATIHELSDRVEHFRSRYMTAQKTISRLEAELDRLKEKCQVFLDAIEHFPSFVRVFNERMKARIMEKLAAERESQEKAERRYWAKQHPHNPNKKKKDRGRDEVR